MAVSSNDQASVVTVTEAIVLIPEASGGAENLLNFPKLHLTEASQWVNQHDSGSLIERSVDGGVLEKSLMVMYPHTPASGSHGL